MLALAAAGSASSATSSRPEADNPAFQVAAAHTRRAYDDIAALDAFARAVDVVTYEFENVPGRTAAFSSRRVPCRPAPRRLPPPGPAGGEDVPPGSASRSRPLPPSMMRPALGHAVAEIGRPRS